MRQTFAIIVLLSITAFPFINTLWFENPAMVYDSPRKIFGLESYFSFDLNQNLITLSDVNKLLKGEEIVIDKSRLELVGDFAVFNPDVFSGGSLWLGIGSLRFGLESVLFSNLTLYLPKEMLRVLLGDVDFNENLDKQFTMFKGGFALKNGLFFGFEPVRNYTVTLVIGAFQPFYWFDESSEVRFFYRSDENTATLETGVDGEVKVYTSMAGGEGSAGNLGYYMDIGAMAKFGNLKAAVSVNSITISPAKLAYEGYVSVVFKASYENLKFDLTGPEMKFPEEFEALQNPVDVSLPVELTMALSYEWSLADFGLHMKVIPDLSRVEYGLYTNLMNLLWIDLTAVNDAWKKVVGLNLDLRLFRITATAGVIDYGGLFNFDPAKMTGFSISAGLGFGF